MNTATAVTIAAAHAIAIAIAHITTTTIQSYLPNSYLTNNFKLSMYKQMLYNHSSNAHVMRLAPRACTYERKFVPGGGLREQHFFPEAASGNNICFPEAASKNKCCSWRPPPGTKLRIGTTDSQVDAADLTICTTDPYWPNWRSNLLAQLRNSQRPSASYVLDFNEFQGQIMPSLFASSRRMFCKWRSSSVHSCHTKKATCFCSLCVHAKTPCIMM